VNLKWICVFCGSSKGIPPLYAEHAREFARLLVGHGMGLVYGGASVGLMGIIADAVTAAGGETIGVIPRSLVVRELAHPNLTRLIVTETLTERKTRMVELSDALVALPGGAGTLDELFEVWTAAQLGLHTKPMGLLNSGGYYDPLLAFVDRAVTEGFLASRQRDLLLVATTPQQLLSALTQHTTQ
jgi:uncharacterized protein (TIGR00730 family)